jgi:general secretion pathway protein K
MQLFLTGVVMAQGISQGVPLFGVPNDFLQTLKGQGLMGTMLSTLGIKPVKFGSESDFTKSISTDSKVFSIYAVGVVKGYRRETRVKVHAVVDYRQAPTLSNLAAAAGISTSGSSSSAASTTASASASGSSQTDPNAIAAALTAGIGGNVLFFNIE